MPRRNNSDDHSIESQSSSSQQIPALVGTPKLIDIGLSKDTLQKIGFKFKEESINGTTGVPIEHGHGGKMINISSDKNRNVGEIPITSDGFKDNQGRGSGSSINGDPNKTDGHGHDEFIASSDNDSPPISILKTANPGGPPVQLKQSKVNEESYMNADVNEDLTVTSELSSIINISARATSTLSGSVINSSNMSMEVSRVEISPGLVVRRPSTRQRLSKQKIENGFKIDEIQEKPECTNEAFNANKNSEIIPKEESLPIVGDESPVMPSLKTVDVQKFLQELKQKDAKLTTVDSGNTNEENPQDNKEVSHSKSPLQHVEQNLQMQIDLNSDVTSSPEMPELKTVDVAKYLSTYQSFSNNQPKNNDVDHVLQDSTTNFLNKNNAESKTPDLPDLATIDPKTLHAMTIGRKPISFQSSTENPGEHSTNGLSFDSSKFSYPLAQLQKCKNPGETANSASVLVVSEDNSPVCPVLSESSKELLNKLSRRDGTD